MDGPGGTNCSKFGNLCGQQFGELGSPHDVCVAFVFETSRHTNMLLVAFDK